MQRNVECNFAMKSNKIYGSLVGGNFKRTHKVYPSSTLDIDFTNRIATQCRGGGGVLQSVKVKIKAAAYNDQYRCKLKFTQYG